MKLLFKCGFGILAFAAPLPAQQVGFLDLTQPPLIASQKTVNESLPAGCTKMGGGVFHGWRQPKDGKKRKIALEFVKLKSKKLAAGSEFEVGVRLTNRSHDTIEVPWAIDPAIANAGPDVDHPRFELAELGVEVVKSDGSLVRLQMLSSSLFGSQYSMGTMRKIEPGEWITAKIKVRMDSLYHFSWQTLPDGKARLIATWQQSYISRSLNRSSCQGSISRFDYDKYYEQQSKPATITIKQELPLNSRVNDINNKEQDLK
jgi:hypothetical protein